MGMVGLEALDYWLGDVNDTRKFNNALHLFRIQLRKTDLDRKATFDSGDKP
jgi:hypothetical protein